MNLFGNAEKSLYELECSNSGRERGELKILSGWKRKTLIIHLNQRYDL